MASLFALPFNVGIPSTSCTLNVDTESQFWTDPAIRGFEQIVLKDFKITDWFPRIPGLYWSEWALSTREFISGSRSYDDTLGFYLTPTLKRAHVKNGIGTIRLRPRRIDGEYCWFATALKGTECHTGIPLVIPETLLRTVGLQWGDRVKIEGHLRFLFDFGLDGLIDDIHHSRPLAVFVDKLETVATGSADGIILTPVVLFRDTGQEIQYGFVHCSAGSDKELDNAAEWIGRYADKFDGRVITNFDEQRPLLADAPLSFQKFVGKSYDHLLLEKFVGTIQANRIERIVEVNIGGTYMGHNINVAGSAIINIDSMLSNVTQTLGSESVGLDPAQKSQLEGLVQSLKADLDNLKASYPDEAQAIADALQKTVSNAVKPPEERKKSLLLLSANGLKEAAELVKDIAPSILTTVGLIAKFIMGLS